MINLSIFKPEYCLGLYICSHRISAVLLKQGDESKQPVYCSEVISDENMFAAQTTTLLEKLLSEILQQFSRRYKGKYIPVQISLADPLIKTAVFDVASVPAKQQARDELIRLRFDKQYHVKMFNMSIASDVCYGVQSKQIYALATRSDTIELISRVCKQQGFLLKALDAAVHYLFNNVSDLMQESASLLQLNNDYWTLLVWDQEKHIRYMRSKWFRSDEAGREGELEGVLLDVERLLHSFIESDATESRESNVTMLYVDNSVYDRLLLQAMLEQRMENKFMFLDQLSNELSAYKKDHENKLAALTAVCR